MTTAAAVYTGNDFEKFFEHVGHDAKVVFLSSEKLVAELPKFIKAAEDTGGDVKQIVPLVQNVIAASLTFAKPAIAIGAAISTAGTNLAADEAAISIVISSAGSLESALTTFVAAVKALALAIGADWDQLVADLDVAA
jgi:hypothetical protein